MSGGVVKSDGPFADQVHWSCCPTFRDYGVWLPDLGSAPACWFVAGDSGLVFRTNDLGYARAVAKSCGGEVKGIGHDGEPAKLPE